MRKILVILLLFGTILNSIATDYYFSTLTGASDSNNGLTALTPKTSVSAMQAVINALNPGDNLYLERGSVWYECELLIYQIEATSGSPIRITSYGTGDMPVLSGEKLLTSPTQSGNIWTYFDTDLPEVELTTQSYGRRYLGSVTMNGTRYATSRYPNTTYLKSTASGSTTLTDTENWTTNQWQNGWIGLKNVNWQWSTVRVLSNTSTTLTTSAHITTASIGNPSGEKWYYFLNAYAAMDLPGEWYWTDNQLSIYSTSQPTTVYASVIDTILTIDESDYIYIDSVEFRGANFYGIKVSDGNYNKINACKFDGIGEDGIYVFGEWTAPPDPGLSVNNEITNSEFTDCLLASIFFRGCAGGTVEGNYIHRNSLHNAYHNHYEDVSPNEMHGYAIAVRVNLSNEPMIRRNFIDSTAAGITTHYNAQPIHFRENFIRNYGLTELGDLGGFYSVSDNYSTATKNVKRNFFIDAHDPQYCYYDYYSASYTHAVYMDQDSYSVKADSNSIQTSNCALFTNGGKYRSYKYNKIVNPNAFGMHSAHAHAIHHSYQLPLMNGTDATDDDISYNTFVLNNTYPTISYSFWVRQDVYGCYFPKGGTNDYNSVFNPGGNQPDIVEIKNYYDTYAIYNRDEWAASSFSCDGVTYTPGDNNTYSSTPYTAQKMFKNWDDDAHVFPLTATYVTESGAAAGTSITVPPFYSTLLFATAGNPNADNDINIDTTLSPMLSSVYAAPVADTCDAHITVYDTVVSADSTAWYFENSLAAQYGSITLTGSGTVQYENNFNCQGTYGLSEYTEELYSSSVNMLDSFEISFCYTTFTTTAGWTLAGNKSDGSGSGWLLKRGPSGTVIFITENSTGDRDSSSTVASSISGSGTPYTIKIIVSKTYGFASILVNGIYKTSTDSSIRTDFNTSGSFSFMADVDGANRPFSYTDSLKVKYYGSIVTASDSCVQYTDFNLFDTLHSWMANDMYGVSVLQSASGDCGADSMATIADDNGYLVYYGIEFDSVVNRLYIAVDGDPTNDSYIEIRLDSPNGIKITEHKPKESGCYIYEKTIANITGTHDIYVVLNKIDFNKTFYYMFFDYEQPTYSGFFRRLPGWKILNNWKILR